MRVLFVNFNNKMSQSKDFLIRLKEQQNVTNLACMANLIINEHHSAKISDYDIENLANEQILKDFEAYKPHVIVAHVEYSNLKEHLGCLKHVHEHNNSVKIIVHSNYLYNLDSEELCNFNLDCVDAILREEPDDMLAKLLEALFENYPIKKISNVRYQTEGKNWKKTDSVFFNHLDMISVAYRKGLKNELYKSVTGDKPMAVIKVTRGSNSDCIYDNVKLLEGHKIRYRTPESIAREVELCYKEYGITEFYLEAEDFNFLDWWAYDVAHAIRNTDTVGKIHWMTKIHLKELNQEVVEQMQFAGFNLALLNLCSGAEETLKRARLGVSSIDHYKKGIDILHKFGIRTYAIYKIGFPWETKKHISETIKLIDGFNHTHLDFQILSPIYNCAAVEIVQEAEKLGTLNDLQWSITGTRYLKQKELESQYKQFIQKNKLFSKFKKEKVSENLYTLSDADKKAIKRKVK